MGHGNGHAPLIPPGKMIPLATPKRQIVKIAICVPSRGVCDAGFTFDFANLMSWTTQELVSRGVDVIMNMQMSSYIHANRTDLASLALEDKAVTHLFWLDDDMRFPKNSIARLLQHRQPIVGVNYSHRKPPPQPVATKRCVTKNKSHRLVTDENSTGLECVEGIGFGVTLIEREVFENTPFPWFEHHYDHEQKQAIGEDTWFCWIAQQAGYPVFVDHDLSKEIRHAGSLEYSLEHANNWAAIALEQKAAAVDEAVKAASQAPKPQLILA